MYFIGHNFAIWTFMSETVLNNQETVLALIDYIAQKSKFVALFEWQMIPATDKS